MEEFGGLGKGAPPMLGPGGSPTRRPSKSQRLREARTDRRLELIAATGGVVLALLCTGLGAIATVVAWSTPAFWPVTVIGEIAALSGVGLTVWFGLTIWRTLITDRELRRAEYADLRDRSSRAPRAVHVPFEWFTIAVVLGAVAGALVGIDLGALILLIGGRTLWNLPPATTQLSVVVLPLLGLLPLAMTIVAGARRAWLRPPTRWAGVAWMVGAIGGFAASGVIAHLPEV